MNDLPDLPDLAMLPMTGASWPPAEGWTGPECREPLPVAVDLD